MDDHFDIDTILGSQGISFNIFHGSFQSYYRCELKTSDIPLNLSSILYVQKVYQLIQTSQITLQYISTDFELKICIPFDNQLRYIYLPVIIDDIQPLISRQIQYLLRVQDQLTSNISRIRTETQEGTEQLEQVFEQASQERKQINRLISHWSNQIHTLGDDLNKVNKQVLVIDEEIINCKRGIDLQCYRKETGNQKRQQRKRIVHLNELSKLPSPGIIKVVNGPINIQTLNLSKCDIKYMKFVEIYSQLQDIILQSNSIRKIDGLSQLLRLKTLQLRNNKIQRIQGLNNNVELRYLGLQCNKISKLENIYHLGKLEIISLSENRIEQIPKKIESLQSLVELRIINNKLNTIPSQILNLKKLKILSILGNPCYNDRHKDKELLNRLTNIYVMLACAEF